MVRRLYWGPSSVQGEYHSSDDRNRSLANESCANSGPKYEFDGKPFQTSKAVLHIVDKDIRTWGYVCICKRCSNVFAGSSAYLGEHPPYYNLAFDVTRSKRVFDVGVRTCYSSGQLIRLLILPQLLRLVGAIASDKVICIARLQCVS
jgi:hypothetical protein